MGVWGIAAQAGVTAILYAALSLAESAVAGFRKGGLVTGNQRTVQVNEEGQEFILNARATALNLRDLTTINQKNYSIEEYVLKERPDIKQKLIAEALLRDKRHIRIQTEMFQNLVANERYEKEMAKNDNKDLLNEIKEMKKTLEIQNEEIKYLTKITERGKFKLMLEADSDSIFKKAEIKRQSRAYRT